jgi:hypothetical protein
MRAFSAGFAAMAFGALFAAGCSQGGSAALAPVDTDAKAVEALVAKLTTDNLKGKATAAADIAAVRDALPKEVSLTWGNLSFDAASGATVLTQVKLSPKDMPSVGIGIDELRLFDFDAEFAKARLTGQRLTETASLARRIDAKGVSMFGLAGLMNGMMGGMTEIGAAPADPSAPPADPNAPASEDWPATTEPQMFDDQAWDASAFRTTFEKYEAGYGRVILDDVVLRPFEVGPVKTAASADDPFAQIMPLLQPAAAVMKSFGVDTAAFMDFKGDIAMTQMGQSIAGSVGSKAMGMRGLRGGDVDAAYMRDMFYNFAGGNMMPAMQWNVSLYTIEDLRLDKIYGYIAKGQMPPRTETDLLSGGLWHSENENLKMGGMDIYSVGESNIDARKFHWFIPTDLKTSGKNVTLNVGNFMKLGEQMTATMQQQMGVDAAPGGPDMKAVLAALEKNGLDKPVMNYNFGWNWDATSGETKVDLGFGADKVMQITTKFEGGFPSFKAVSDLIPDDVAKTNEQAIASLFDQTSKLKLVDVNIVDNGGLEKTFNLVADLGPIMAAGDPSGFNPFEGQTGASIRQMASGMLMMLGATPDLAPYVTPFGNFITQGGKLHIALQPPQPMAWSAVGEKLSGTSQQPAVALKELGLKVEHSK